MDLITFLLVVHTLSFVKLIQGKSSFFLEVKKPNFKSYKKYLVKKTKFSH